MSIDVIFYERGVYGHQENHVEKSKSSLNGDIIDDINYEHPTKVLVPTVRNTPSSLSSSSPNPSPSPTRKVRILNDIY